MVRWRAHPTASSTTCARWPSLPSVRTACTSEMSVASLSQLRSDRTSRRCVERRERLEGSVDIEGNLSVAGSTQDRMDTSRLATPSGHLADGMVATDQLGGWSSNRREAGPGSAPRPARLCAARLDHPRTGRLLQHGLVADAGGQWLAAFNSERRLKTFWPRQSIAGGCTCSPNPARCAVLRPRRGPRLRSRPPGAARRDFAVGFVGHHLLVVGGTEEGSRQPTGATTRLDAKRVGG